MSAVKSVTMYYRRFLGLGWARVFLVLGVLFTVFAIASPIWSMTDGTGGTYSTAAFGWSTVTETIFHNGVWTETRIQSYSPNGFDAPTLANAIGGSYLMELVLLIVFVIATALYSLRGVAQMREVGLLLIGLLVVIVGLVALLYAIFTVPSAAATDLGSPAITGFWGSAPPVSWGPGLGWWFLLIGVVFGIIGGTWPFLQALRHPGVRAPPPPPREWQVER